MERSNMDRSNPRRGGILGTLLAIVGTVVVVGIAGSVLMGLYVARNVHVSSTERDKGADVSIQTPVGSMHLRAREDVDPGKLGVPVYPGARRDKDSASASFEWNPNEGEGKNVSVVGGSYFSEDRPSKVLQYYKDQLPSWIVVTEKHGETRLELKEGGYKRIVAIAEKDGGSRIGIAAVGEPGSN